MDNLAPDDRIAKMIAETLKLDAAAPKGPWEYDPEDGVIASESGGLVAHLADETHPNRVPYAHENGHLIARYRSLAPDLARELEAATARVTSLEATNAKLAEDGAKLAAELQEHERRLTLWRSLSEEERVFALAAMRDAARGLGLAIGRAHWWATLVALVEPATPSSRADT